MESDRGLRVRKAVIGFAALLLIGQFARTMAADLLPADPAPSESPAPTAAPSDQPTSTPTDAAPSPSDSSYAGPTISPAPSNSAASPTPSDSTIPIATDSPSPTATPTHLPPHAIANQAMTLRIPSVVEVDPRAHSVYLPHIDVAGPSNLLICISGPGMVFDIYGQNQTDPKKGTLVIGDQTSSIQSSGIGTAPVSVVNGTAGLRVISSSGGIAGHSLHISFVALSEPSLDPTLCGAGSASNNRTILIQSIGLNVDMLKGNVTLKK